MIPDVGNLFLYLALICSFCIALLPVLQAIYKDIGLRPLKILWCTTFIFIVSALLCLIYSYVVSDFTVLNVVYNSHSSKPLLYKIVGSWGNHEGSMLLWISSVTFFSAAFALFVTPNKTTFLTLSLQAILNCFFISFTIFSCNPFNRVFPPPLDGLGLNPILQDIGLALHPPLLYLGYVGFSLAYSSAIAGLINNDINSNWARLIRPWVMLSWSFLTVGIGLGSWWAYRELGWGGFWFWDPVENASIIPWLTATALLHSLLVYQKTGHLRNWSVLLAIITFALSITGTFLVRSGVVTSVHAFAHDPQRGIFILIFLAVFTGASLILYALRETNNQTNNTTFFSKITLITFNNLFLVAAAFTVILGTLYPMFLELFIGQKISVGAPYFNKIFTPFMVALCFLCLVGSQLSWQNNSMMNFVRKNYVTLLITFILTIFIIQYYHLDHPLICISIFASLWLLIVMFRLYFLSRYYYRIRLTDRFYSMFFAHVGFGIIVLAISLNSALKNDLQVTMRIGESVDFNDLQIKLQNVVYDKKQNYLSQIGYFTVQKDDRIIAKMFPETRFFRVEKQQTAESAILHNLFYDVYITINEVYTNNSINVNLYYRPMMGWIWFGCILIFFSGIYSIAIQILQRRKNI